MKATFIPGVPRLSNTLRSPQYVEEDYLLIVLWRREFWVRISPLVADQLYEWL